MQASSPPAARLLSLATAVPPFELPQASVSAAAATLFAGHDSPYPRLRSVYDNAGISKRYGALPLDELAQPRGWHEWHRIFRPAALALLEEAAEKALAEAGRTPSQVDTLLVACSTGFTVPSLDALLLDRLPFRRSVERVPLVGYGCAGGVLGLARAAALARARPGTTILFLTVELCTLTFRPGDRSRTNLVATALFGDGAAAAVVTCDESADAPVIGASGEHCWPESEWIMGWSVEDDGLAVCLAPGLPDLIRSDAGPLVGSFLDSQGLETQDVDHWVLHPGGAKVLRALGDCLPIPDAHIAPARRILRNKGNMSAPTVLFVLRDILSAGAAGRLLCLAFGPGFTAAFLLLDVSGSWPPSR